jgi:hypothetical protein
LTNSLEGFTVVGVASWSPLPLVKDRDPTPTRRVAGVRKGGNMPTAEVTLEDVERLDDRLAHAEQYMKEALAAVHEAAVLAAKIDPEDEDAA